MGKATLWALRLIPGFAATETGIRAELEVRDWIKYGRDYQAKDIDEVILL